MAVKLFLDNILSFEVYSFEEFSNQHKNDGMVNSIQYSNTVAVNIVAILKTLLLLPKIVSNIVLISITPTG